jgi:hypothetical protein
MDKRKRYNHHLTTQKGGLYGEKTSMKNATLHGPALVTPVICAKFGHNWIRVFEVGPDCEADATAIEASFNNVENQYIYLQGV